MTWPDASDVARALGGEQKAGGGWTAQCPCHEDKNPSLSISNGKDGKLLVKCRAGCEQSDVIAKLKEMGLWYAKEPNRPWEKREPPTPAKPSEDGEQEWLPVAPVPDKATKPDFAKLCGSKPSAVYNYRDEEGRLLSYQCRVESDDGSKRFVPISFYADGQWRARGLTTPRPIYGLDRLAARIDAPVLVVEGEKAADAAAKLLPSHVCITWPNGAQAVANADWTPLRDRDVVVWPDADEPGRKAAEAVAEAAQKAGSRSVRIVEVSDALPKGWDLADEAPEELDVEALIAAARPFDRSLARFVHTAAEIRKMKIDPRDSIVEPFLTTSSLTMIYSKRGIGKTWLGLTLGLAIARGDKFLAYKVPSPRNVLSVDGEMPLGDLQQRLRLMKGGDAEDFMLLPSELLFQKDRPLNINNPEDQQRIEQMLTQLDRNGRKPSVIIFDNLSSLGGGVDENDNTALDALLQWLVKLRHQGYAVVLIHHAGKSGDQRGASRREDLLDTSIKLTEVSSDEMPDQPGATFDMEFTKVRGPKPSPNKLRIALRPADDGSLVFQFWETRSPTPALLTLREIYAGRCDEFGMPAGIYRQQKDLAASRGMNKSTISKHVKELRMQEFVDESHSVGLRVTIKGVAALRVAFPTLPKQGYVVEDEDLPF